MVSKREADWEEEARKEFAHLPSERFYTVDDLVATYFYNCWIINLLDARGMGYRGESFKYQVPLCLLVVKVTIETAPVICFINGRSKEICYKIFLRQLLADEVEWRHDKFG